MTDIEIPDNKHAALELEDIANPMDRRGSSGWAYICRGAARRLRADAEEIARLESELATAKTEAAAQRELATLLERESPDPLTRIAAALERPSREWIAVALTIRSAILAGNTLTKLNGAGALGAADSLLAEMGEK